MRQPTLETLGLGSVLDIFKNGGLPVTADALVDEVFGEAGNRGSVVISGANGIVGAGKAMQLGARLQPYGVRIVGLDFPNAPDGIGAQYPGLVGAFGPEGANAIMSSIIRLSYDGKSLPAELATLRPRFLLEAIPEILEIKKEHYRIFREAFPGIEIKSVTSGFPQSELGVGIAHPAFPHEINKIWEMVEPEPSAITKLFWALGLIPMPVSDSWSFVLDVLFCGLTLAASRVHHATNMPYWKIDKYVRRDLGPNPCRAHDAIGSAGATFLTWSCLTHLSKMYGDVFTPTPELTEIKDTGANWYPQNHFRPVVDWKMDDAAGEEFESWILGSLFQMTSLLLHENRAHLSYVNAIGELCAQFTNGILAVARSRGPEGPARIVSAYHRLHPEAAGESWYPEVFERMGDPEWQQLYVNAEHDGSVGVITIAREAYNHDVDAELSRAIDWLAKEGIERVIVTGDFHLSTQMVGADTSDFFPALEDAEKGAALAGGWSRTARRLNDEFKVSVAYLAGKRALGGMLELLTHCHYLVSHDGGEFGFPEVTLPVVPGMEGCHWPLRKASSEDWPKVLGLLLTGRPVKANDAVGWLIDYAGPVEDALATAWKIAAGEDHGIRRREVAEGALSVPSDVPDLPAAGSQGAVTARKAILASVQASCGVPLAEALEVQARHTADFFVGKACAKGAVGAQYTKTMKV
jgi:enoyl-CoA hydratase/carnithine racemase